MDNSQGAFAEAISTEPMSSKVLSMRCYFNLVSGHEVIADEIGVEVASLGVAKAEALKAIHELRLEPGSEEDWIGWRLEVVCSEGSLLYSIDLDTSDL